MAEHVSKGLVALKRRELNIAREHFLEALDEYEAVSSAFLAEAYGGLAKVYFLQGRFQQCLQSCSSAFSHTEQPSSSLLLIASRACLALGHAAKALKYASNALFMKPQDATARQLSSSSTKEMEYDARLQALQHVLMMGQSEAASWAASRMRSQRGEPGGAHTSDSDVKTCWQLLRSLLRQISAAEDETSEEHQAVDSLDMFVGGAAATPAPAAVPRTTVAAEQGIPAILSEICKVLIKGGTDAQICFQLLGGFPVVLSYLSTPYYLHVAEVLLAAGACHLYTSGPKAVNPAACATPSATARASATSSATAWPLVAGLAALMQLEGAGGLPHAAVRVRWPQMVLDRLAAVVSAAATAATSSDGRATAESASGAADSSRAAAPSPVECALMLLAYAAQDPLQRQTGLVAGSPPLPVRQEQAPEPCCTPPRHHQHISRACPVDDTDMASPVAPQTPEQYAEPPMWQNPNAPTTPSQAVYVSHGARHARGDMYSAVPPVLLSPLARVTTALLDSSTDSSTDDQLPVSFLSRHGIMAVAQLLASYTLGSDVDRNLLAREVGTPLQYMLQLYCGIPHVGSSRVGSGAGRGGSSSSRPLCCVTSRLVATACLEYSTAEPTLVHREAFRQLRRSSSSCSSRSGGDASKAGKLVAGPLLSQIVQLTRLALSSCPAASRPELGADGSVQSYRQGRAEVLYPCLAGPASSSSSVSGSGSGPGFGAAGPAAGASRSLLEIWVRLLAAAAGSSKAVCRELYRADAPGVLDTIYQAMGGGAGSSSSSSSGVVSAAELAYGALARGCETYVDEACCHKAVPPLLGIALSSSGTGFSPTGSPGTTLRALDTLCTVVDSCSGADYAALTRPAGVLAAAHRLLVASLPPGALRPPSAPQAPRSAGNNAPVPPAARPISAAAAAAAGVGARLANPPVIPPATPRHDSSSGSSQAAPPPGGHARSTSMSSNSSSGSGAGSCGSSKSMHFWTAAVAGASASATAAQDPVAKILAAAGSDPTGAAAKGSGSSTAELRCLLQEAGSSARPFLDSARCLFLACLERSRRQAGLKPTQAPRGPFWDTLRPKELLLLERKLRQDWSAALPPAPPALALQPPAPAASARPGPVRKASSPPVPPSPYDQAQAQAESASRFEVPVQQQQQQQQQQGACSSAAGAELPLPDTPAQEQMPRSSGPGGSLRTCRSVNLNDTARGQGLLEGVSPRRSGEAARQLLQGAASSNGPLPGPFEVKSQVPAAAAAEGKHPAPGSRQQQQQQQPVVPARDGAAGKMAKVVSMFKSKVEAIFTPKKSDDKDQKEVATKQGGHEEEAAARRGGHDDQAAARQEGYDEDGVRLVWDNAPSPLERQAREAWKSVALRHKVSWGQTSSEINVWIKVPKGTKRHEVQVDISPSRLCLRLTWCGRVVDGPLTRRVKARESVWVMEGEARDGSEFDSIHIMMPKDELHYWRSLFEGGEERSHVQLLQEAVEADEPVVGVDDLDEGAREILESLRDRQAMVAAGLFDLKNSFDDFRVVIGDGTL